MLSIVSWERTYVRLLPESVFLFVCQFPESAWSRRSQGCTTSLEAGQPSSTFFSIFIATPLTVICWVKMFFCWHLQGWRRCASMTFPFCRAHIDLNCVSYNGISRWEKSNKIEFLFDWLPLMWLCVLEILMMWTFIVQAEPRFLWNKHLLEELIENNVS